MEKRQIEFYLLSMNQHDNFLFSYFTQINWKCILGFNINKLKRELKLENKVLKEFYIRIQTDIPYNQKDSFNNYELYTYAEGFINFDFDEFGNLKTKTLFSKIINKAIKRSSNKQKSIKT